MILEYLKQPSEEVGHEEHKILEQMESETMEVIEQNEDTQRVKVDNNKCMTTMDKN